MSKEAVDLLLDLGLQGKRIAVDSSGVQFPAGHGMSDEMIARCIELIPDLIAMLAPVKGVERNCPECGGWLVPYPLAVRHWRNWDCWRCGKVVPVLDPTTVERQGSLSGADQ